MFPAAVASCRYLLQFPAAVASWSCQLQLPAAVANCICQLQLLVDVYSCCCQLQLPAEVASCYWQLQLPAGQSHLIKLSPPQTRCAALNYVSHILHVLDVLILQINFKLYKQSNNAFSIVLKVYIKGKSQPTQAATASREHRRQNLLVNYLHSVDSNDQYDRKWPLKCKSTVSQGKLQLLQYCANYWQCSHGRVNW